MGKKEDEVIAKKILKAGLKYRRSGLDLTAKSTTTELRQSRILRKVKIIENELRAKAICDTLLPALASIGLLIFTFINICSRFDMSTASQLTLNNT